VGYLAVVDNPYGAISAPDFSISEIPVGKWKATVWHADLEAEKKEIEVEIKEGAATEITVEFKAPKYLLPKKEVPKWGETEKTPDAAPAP